jgi:hypothetical protein
MRSLTLLLASALTVAACGGKATPATATSNHGQPPPVTVADDIAAITSVIGGAPAAEWPKRVTFLGWTADHRVAYRQLLCVVDELGARGDWCDLSICTMGAPTNDEPAEAACEEAATFELGEPTEFVAADATATADATLAKLGPLTTGTSLDPTASGLTIDAMTLYYEAAGQPRHPVMKAFEQMEGVGVSNVTATHVTRAPDGACFATLGIAHYNSEYEGVRGTSPRAVAAVACSR